MELKKYIENTVKIITPSIDHIQLVEYKNELEKVRVLYYKLLGAIESTETLLSLEEEEKKK